MSDPIPRKLLNDRDPDGALRCPGCRERIALHIGVKFFGAHAFHIACGRLLQPLQESEDRAREIMKRHAELRDQADVLSRESEATIEKAKQARQGRQAR